VNSTTTVAESIAKGSSSDSGPKSISNLSPWPSVLSAPPKAKALPSKLPFWAMPSARPVSAPGALLLNS